MAKRAPLNYSYEKKICKSFEMLGEGWRDLFYLYLNFQNEEWNLNSSVSMLKETSRA
jgi:hypothetical protein